MRKPCSIPGCGKPTVARGWCARHYSRWKNHGDPTAGRTDEGAVLAWIELHVSHDSDECLVFPFARKDSGYGAVLFRGHIIGAHRAMCILAHGEPPAAGLMAAHSCGRGSAGCVNPKHLRWATAVENAEDLSLHREAGIAPDFPSRVTADDCRAIVAAKGTEFMKVTAKRYGISESMVCRIQRGNRRTTATKRVA